MLHDGPKSVCIHHILWVLLGLPAGQGGSPQSSAVLCTGVMCAQAQVVIAVCVAGQNQEVIMQAYQVTVLMWRYMQGVVHQDLHLDSIIHTPRPVRLAYY